MSGRVRHDVDRTADGVSAEQSALRALQDLDPVDIEQILVGADRARQVGAVDIHAHGRIEVESEIVLADTADRGGQDRCIAGKGRTGIEVDVGGQGGKGVNIGDASALHGFSGKRGDRDGDLLKVFGTARSGYHDLFERVGRGREGRDTWDQQACDGGNRSAETQRGTVQKSARHDNPLKYVDPELKPAVGAIYRLLALLTIHGQISNNSFALHTFVGKPSSRHPLLVANR